ncbi:MAG: dihydrolipoyl dehydrogenase family protein [Nitrospinaceae bacterium]
MQEFDIAVLGGGIAGISAARRAAELDAKVCLIEKKRLGGNCFHQGLYPYQRIIQQIRVQQTGHPVEDSGPDIKKIIQEAKEVCRKISGQWQASLTECGIHLEMGQGFLVNAKELVVHTSEGEKLIRARKIILAPGSSTAAPTTLPFDGHRIISSEQASNMDEIPEKVLILGGDSLGCETACLFNHLRSRTFLCDSRPRLMMDQDPDLTQALETQLKKQKLKLLLNKKVLSIYKNEDKIDITLEGGIRFDVNQIVHAGDRNPNSQELGTQNPGLELGNYGEVLVDEMMETTLKGVYAVGSVTGRPLSDCLSQEEGRVAAENALGKTKKLNIDWVPRIIHTDPEIASVGCFARDAHHKGFRAVEGRCDFSQLDHAFLHGESEGMIKIVAEKSTRKVIGAQIVAPRASEFIPLMLLAIKKGLTVHSLGRLSCGFSTRFQGVWEAARACIRAIKQESGRPGN